MCIRDRTVVDAATGELQPQIAESWDQNSDTSYTFHIRQGVKFHDGSEVKAEDVKFSLDRAINSAAVSYIVDFIDKVDVVDDYTVNVELKDVYKRQGPTRLPTQAYSTS